MHYIGLRDAKGRLMQTDRKPVLWPDMEAAIEANQKMGDKYTPVVITLIITEVPEPETVPGIPEGVKLVEWVEVDPRDFNADLVSGTIYIANTTNIDIVIKCDDIDPYLDTAAAILDSLGIANHQRRDDAVVRFRDSLRGIIKPGESPFLVYITKDSVVIRDGETVLTYGPLLKQT